MNVIQIILDSNAQQQFAYKICDQLILCNKQLQSLSAFSTTMDEDAGKFSPSEAPIIDNQEISFEGTSWLVEKHRKIICSKTINGLIVDVPEITAFFVSHDGCQITQLADCKSTTKYSELELEYILLGPAFMLALALNQLFALHASAVCFEDKAILFTGASGFGKSTMARELQQMSGLERLSDDISIISKSQLNFCLNADFPQLKLQHKSQNSQGSLTSLRAIIVLDRQSDTDNISLIALDSINAVQVLLNHSVAVQLFDRTLATQHLKFMADLAARVPIYKLAYPDGLEKIPQIAGILKRELD